VAGNGISAPARHRPEGFTYPRLASGCSAEAIVGGELLAALGGGRRRA
jgi:hypothetical protein